MVHKVQENDRIVAVERRLILRTEQRFEAALKASTGEPDGQHLVRRESARERG
jgi:hypothetical protein